MWDLPGPEFEPVSPGLAGGFLTTAPPGKPPVETLRLVSTWVIEPLVWLNPQGDDVEWDLGAHQGF